MDNSETYGGVPTAGPNESPYKSPAPPITQAAQVEVDDSKSTAQYANFCRLSGMPEELLIDFGLNPQPMGIATKKPSGCLLLIGLFRQVIRGFFPRGPHRTWMKLGQFRALGRSWERPCNCNGLHSPVLPGLCGLCPAAEAPINARLSAARTGRGRPLDRTRARGGLT